ncbi:hypothetical protein WOLCODRAFT_27076 [Wolfiporia cocos MD-104 SS10]|uniref:Uncharacterized protein n=1 Tax=Wolfiporia cocos (strain MD-104) TaxID=742152 RepID=A0A2H3JXV2_WOLCO|nr:hypothetical protein WOLCODRAFT_27076 [Wolfiporia cocos MD-104 SS10]
MAMHPGARARPIYFPGCTNFLLAYPTESSRPSRAVPPPSGRHADRRSQHQFRSVQREEHALSVGSPLL